MHILHMLAGKNYTIWPIWAHPLPRLLRNSLGLKIVEAELLARVPEVFFELGRVVCLFDTDKVLALRVVDTRLRGIRFPRGRHPLLNN